MASFVSLKSFPLNRFERKDWGSRTMALFFPENSDNGLGHPATEEWPKQMIVVVGKSIRITNWW